MGSIQVWVITNSAAINIFYISFGKHRKCISIRYRLWSSYQHTFILIFLRNMYSTEKLIQSTSGYTFGMWHMRSQLPTFVTKLGNQHFRTSPACFWLAVFSPTQWYHILLHFKRFETNSDSSVIIKTKKNTIFFNPVIPCDNLGPLFVFKT